MANLNFVFNRAIKLIINPKDEWIAIQAETQTKKTTINKYALPWMIIISLCSIIGDLFNSFSMGVIISKAIISFALAFFVMYLSAIIINEITTSFNSKKDIDTTFKLVIYSLTGYFVMAAITYLIPLPPMQMLMVFAFYSIYLFWLGSTPLTGTPEDNKVGFVVVSSLIILGIYAVLSLIFRALLFGIFSINLLVR